MASLPEVAVVALCAAEGCARLLKPILDFLANRMSPRSAAADAAIVAALLALVFAHLVCVFLVYLSVTTPSGGRRCREAVPCHRIHAGLR